MHEASLMRNLMRKLLEIASAQNATRVAGLRVKLGALSHMSRGHFLEHFEQAAAGTLAEGAVIETVEDDDITAETAADVLLERVDLQ